MPAVSPVPGPFDLDDERAYRAWRERKLEGCPTRLEQLIVELDDPRRLRPAERAALVDRCMRANIALYTSRVGTNKDKEITRQLGLQLGLSRLDRNFLADGDGISAITCRAGMRGEFIPYTDRPMRWHTDGCYNPPEHRVLAMTLHCVHAAGEGGENALIDHELAYIVLRDENPAHIEALSAADAMSIPPRYDGGTMARPARMGPVFSVDESGGTLHMRYTMRATNVVWKENPQTHAALSCLKRLLSGDSPCIFRARLEPGMGIVCNNVLHRRARFRDSADRRRLLYRARYYDRIATA